MTINSTHCPNEKKKIESKLKEAEEKVTNMMAEKNAKIVNQQLSQLSSIDETLIKLKYGK